VRVHAKQPQQLVPSTEAPTAVVCARPAALTLHVADSAAPTARYWSCRDHYRVVRCTNALLV
jgi:hypothetical protein